MTRLIDLSGQRFGRLYVQKQSPITNKEGSLFWNCICDCGNTKTVLGQKLREGRVKSCGCLKIDSARELGYSLNATHHGSSLPEYSSWQNMKSRCLYESTVDFHNYGGRGITVCDRWLNSFEAFYADMGPKPTPNHSIDRYPDMNGNYEPGNCRWATLEEQASNKRTNVFYEHNGQRYTRTQLCALTGVNTGTFSYRIKCGKTIEEALK